MQIGKKTKQMRTEKKRDTTAIESQQQPERGCGEKPRRR
jgi:hypothetical protein